MGSKRRILLKITGTLLETSQGREQSCRHAHALIMNICKQIAALQATHAVGIVIGGGNFFRGSQQGKALGITPSVGHQVGMLATLMNGLLLQDLLAQNDVKSTVLSAVYCPAAGNPITHEKITQAIDREQVIIFVGGTGIPYVTTDTNAVIRALQMGAERVIKCTDVDGVYSADPKKDPAATRYSTLTHEEALAINVGVIDKTALTIAQEHGLAIQIAPLFEPNSLARAIQEKLFGSLISNSKIP